MRYRSVETHPSLPRRTLEYLERGAPEGERNAELFAAAQQFRDAGFGREEAEQHLLPRACADGLGEAEARATLTSAFNHGARKPVCGSQFLSSQIQSSPVNPRLVTPTPDSHCKAWANHETTLVPLPEPIESGFLKLLEACFRPDEFVAVAPSFEDEDGKPTPRRGVTMTAAKWAERVREKGCIDRVFTTKAGLMIRVNPVREGGAADRDVAEFRHVLVEFDTDGAGEVISKERQLGAIIASGLPIAAVIDSGNRSLHAWVAVHAPDAAEYRRRVDAIWALFDGLCLDKRNRNPSRLSRCPDGWRTVDGEPRRQALLALGLGAASWEEWEALAGDGELDGPLTVSRLGTYDVERDPNRVLGERWLCRSASLVVVGQSGIGKSALCMQLMVLWALGHPAFGIRPVRPLRSLLIQAENDEGDLAEMYQGVRAGMGLAPGEEAEIEDRILIYRDTTHAGEEFAALAGRLVDRHRPDLVWADPLLTFIGDDISEQRVISEFCCRRLNAISIRTGVVWCLIHHTGKPSKDPRAAEHWTASDLAYSGLGSSALVNWSRETAVLVRVRMPEGEPPTFQLSMTKRRLRAGLRTPQGMPTDTIFLRHSSSGGILWEQCDAPPEARPRPTGRYRVGRPSGFEPDKFRELLGEFGGSVTAQNVDAIADKTGRNTRTVWRWWKRLNASEI